MLSASYEFILYSITTFPISWIYFQQPGLCGHVQQVISLSLSERCLFMDMLWVQPVRRLDFLLDQVYLIPDLSTRIMSPIFSHVLQIHTWHHRICTYPKQRTTSQVMSIRKTRRMRAKGLADIGFGKPGCRHGLLHERVHKNLHIEPNQDVSCPQHTRTLTTPCCLAHPPPLLSALAGVRGIYIPIIPYP